MTEDKRAGRGSARILVVEDNPTQAQLARALLVGLGHQAALSETAGEAFATAQDWRPDAILLDVELPDYSGFELMKQLSAACNEAAIVVVTANASINGAVEAMRLGATDFIVKPYSKARLAVTLANALEKRLLVTQLRSAQAQLGRDRFFGFIGASPVMQAVYRTIEAVAASKASVFITGESGTGKELAAEAIHKASPRARRAFIALNCGAIPRDLLESEVFGHVRGAFTGATADREGAAKAADGGTLFLDEIGEMPLDMQVKLLRFVQTGSFSPVGGSRVERVDVRFVCATNRDPTLEVQAGRFREDLYYRLYVVPLELPPLRERAGDILLVARHFLCQFSQEEKRRFTGFSAPAEAALAAFSWPGNLRQLQNVMRNVVVLHDGELVELAMIPPPVVRGAAPRVEPEAAPPSLVVAAAMPVGAAAMPGLPTAPDEAVPAAEAVALQQHPARPEQVAPMPLPGSSPPIQGAASAEIVIMPLAEMERRLILTALASCSNDVPRAAALLEINPSTIYRKLQVWKTAADMSPDGTTGGFFVGRRSRRS